MVRRIVLLVLVFFLTTTTSAAASFVRIVVLDTSGSMAGARFSSAIAEIRTLVKQLPPSPDKPVILIPFHGAPHNVATFTDLPSLQSHVNKLQVGGSTNIAAALNAGVEKLKPYAKASQLCLLLYTDGEDTDSGPAALAAAENALDALLATRSQQGLSNLLVCKRWENAQARLLATLSKKGHSEIIDAKDLKIVPATVEPAVRVLRSAWVKDKPLVLEVEGEARLELKGLPFDPSLPTASLTCTTSGSDLKPVTLRPGDSKPMRFTMRIPLSPAIAASGKMTLDFALGALGQFPLKSEIILPLVPTDRITVPVALPPLSIRCSLTATLSPSRPAAWSDALTGKVVQEFTLTCSIRSDFSYPWTAPVTIHLDPEGCRLLAGAHELQFHGPDSQSVLIRLEGRPINSGSSHLSLTLVVRPSPPAGITVDPPHFRLTSAVPLPKPVETKITARVQSTTEPQWTDLVHGIASFEADVSMQVNGPVPADTKLVLVCPAAIKSIQINPALIRTGAQTVRLSMTAEFSASATLTDFTIQAQAPPAVGAVQFLPPPPLALQLKSPAAMQLAMLSPQGASPTVTVRDAGAPVLLTGIPVLLGHNEKTNTGVTAFIEGGVMLGSDKIGPVPLNVPMALSLSLPPMERSFFFDTTVEFDIDTLPSQPSSALIGSRQRCTVILEAPFKRVFWIGAIVFSVIAVMSVTAWAFTRNSSNAGDFNSAKVGVVPDEHVA